MKSILYVLLLCVVSPALTQVAINTGGALADASAMLDISSVTRGLLIPRMTYFQRTEISSPAHGLLIYQTDKIPGFYYNSGTPALPVWFRLGDLLLPYTGSTSISTPAFLVTNLGLGDGIKGIATSSAQTGIIGEAPNQAILGNATATSGAAYGVQGIAASSTGSGVTGFGSSATGQNFGVRGLSASNEGKGIYGFVSSSSGATQGVYGESVSPEGFGVYGLASATSGISAGVYGQTHSSIGYGVQGVGGLVGVQGNGSLGVVGYSNVNTGTGVHGSFTASAIQGNGVYGLTASTSGIGVKGYANAATGVTYGLHGTSVSAAGFGVYGEGHTAFRGTTDDEMGYGIYVTCSHTTGTTRAVYGTVSSPNGFSGYFAGGKFFVNSNVGIGTVSPTVPLQVQSEGASTDIINVKNGSNYLCRIRHSSNGSGGFYLYDATNTASIFLYGDGSSFINSGNLGIGTISPTQLLDVNGGARVRGMTTGTVAGTVYRTSDGTLITGASDMRLKENIQPLQNSLSKVLLLKGVTFTWKADPQKKRSIGFIAQDFEKVIPELGFTNENDGYKGINYAEVTAVLAEAIKELNARNDKLQQQVNQLQFMLEKMMKEKSAQ